MNEQQEAKALKHELKIRFQKRPRQCRKINDSYIGYAARIVCISNNTFYYYPTIQQFQDLDFDKLQYVIPKAGVKLDDILQLKFPPRRTNERNFFSIVLPKNKILKFSKGMKEIIVDEEANGEQTWTFEFLYDIISLPQRQLKQQQALLKEKERQRIKLQEQKKQREKEEKEELERIKEQYNILVHAEQMQVQDNDDYQRKKQEIIEKESKEKSIKECDELFFTRVYRQLKYTEISSVKAAFIEIELLKMIGNFKERAQITVKQFIDEWPYTVDKCIKKNTYYRVNNLSLKLGQKNLNQEFLSNSWVANTILKCEHELNKNLRVPLVALVKYKGFKVFVRACTSGDKLNNLDLDDAIVHGNCTDNWKSNFLIMDNLTIVADYLKLKPYNSEVHYQRVQIHLGNSLKVIQTKTDPFQDIKKLDPENLSQQQSNYKLWYLYDIDEIFPIDLDLEENINQSNTRLRPQFIEKYVDPELQKTRLVGGSLLYAVQDEEGQKEDVIVAKAGQHLKFITLFQFIKGLDSLVAIPYDSESLGRIMKSQGINMRYLGVIHNSTQIPYIKTISQVECVSRVIKNIYRKSQVQFCNHIFRQNYAVKKLIQEAFNPKSQQSLKKMRLKQLKKIQIEKSKINSIDFLNLVFGVGEQTRQFWQIISEKVEAYYKFKIGEYTSLPHGYLLKCVLYHCGFQIIIDDKTALFMEQNPFNQQNWVRFSCKTENLEYPDLKVYTKTNVSQNYSEQTNKRHLQMKLIIRRALRKKELDILIELTKYKDNFVPPKQKYCIQNFFYHLIHPTVENFDTALKIAHFILPSSHPFFIEMYLKYANLKTSKLDVISLKKAAQNHSIRNLGITHWKTSQILSSFSELEYITNLKKAQIGVAKESRSKLYLQIVKEQIHLGRLVECSSYVRKSIEIFGSRDLNDQQIQNYFEILILGMSANYKMRKIENLERIGEFMWISLEKYWSQKYLPWFQELLKITIKSLLEIYNRKHYLYKVIIILKDQIDKKITVKERTKMIKNVYYKCKQSKNHVNWAKELLIKLEFGYLELNFKNDFFNNFWAYFEELGNEDFQEGLKQILELLNILGQEYFELALLDRMYTIQKGDQNFGIKVVRKGRGEIRGDRGAESIEREGPRGERGETWDKVKLASLKL